MHYLSVCVAINFQGPYLQKQTNGIESCSLILQVGNFCLAHKRESELPFLFRQDLLDFQDFFGFHHFPEESDEESPAFSGGVFCLKQVQGCTS